MNIITKALAVFAIATFVPTQAQAVTFVTERSAINGNDRIDWSSLGTAEPFNILPNSFSTTSERGLGVNVEIPPIARITPPFTFQTLPSPGIPTNFEFGDRILFTGFVPGTFPAIGNPGPITIDFDTPVKGAGTQVAVDDTSEFTAFISAFDGNGNSLGSFSTPGTSTLALDNSAAFLGVRNDTANISQLVFNTSVPNRALGINTVTIATVPEQTTTLGFFALSWLGVSLLKKRQNYE